MVLYDHRSIWVLYPCVLIPATEKWFKPLPYRIYCQKQGAVFWSVNYTRSKIPFLCSGNKLQIFKYRPFERTLCIDTYRINFVYQKMELQGNITYLWKKTIIMILEHLQIFVRKTTSESRRCCNVNTRSESQHRKRNVLTTLVFGRRSNVGNITLWQRYPMSRLKYNQNLPLLQSRVPAGFGLQYCWCNAISISFFFFWQRKFTKWKLITFFHAEFSTLNNQPARKF